jgi:hypothetical protein
MWRKEGENLNGKRNAWISLAAAFTAALLVYGVYRLQIRQVDLQRTALVVVPKMFIRSGVRVTSDMVELKPLYKGAFNERMIVRLEEVVGRETLVPLGTQEPVLDWKIDRLHLLPDGSQSTFQIPKEYILSSNGIRAGDYVRIYVSGKDGSSRLLAEDIMVASVKSAANVEVDDPKHSNLSSRLDGDLEQMYASRREANGVIDQINLNLSEEEWFAIDAACKSKQGKLVIAFISSSIQADAWPKPNGGK